MKIYCFIIISLILPIIICAGEECINCDDQSPSPTCHQNCRKSLANGDSNYYYCNFDGGNPYYFINNGCFVKSNCNNYEKRVYNTYECANSCGTNLYELGDFCFKEGEYSPNTEPTSINPKKLNCKYKYYINVESGKSEHICLESEQECPDKYTSYDHDTGLCSTGSCDSLGENKRIKIVNRRSGKKINRCSTDCIGNEYLKITVERSKLVYTCIDTCTTYKNDDPEIKRCYANEEECISDEYKYIQGKICLKECPDYKVKSAVSSQNRITSLGKCYEDINACISKGYKYYNIEKKECWVSCSGFINYDITDKIPINSDTVSNCVDS